MPIIYLRLPRSLILNFVCNKFFTEAVDAASELTKTISSTYTNKAVNDVVVALVYKL